MKKIFIMMHAMELGGAERSLIGLLDSIDYKNYQVDLFLFHHDGELVPYIPKEVNLLPRNSRYGTLERPIKSVLKKGHFVIAGKRLWGKLKAKAYLKKHGITGDNGVELEYSHKYTVRHMPFIKKEVVYDLAISFITPHYFTLKKVNAKKKLAFIHTDYNHFPVDEKEFVKIWGGYDYIASISDTVTQGFCKKFPALKDKVIDVGNILPKTLIESDAEKFSVEDEMKSDGSLKLLSIGRFCEAKNYDNVPFIMKELLSFGVKAKWYLIGFGPDEEKIKRKIKEAGMEDFVIILGKKENPYPYLKACDIYMQPSRFEGKAVTVLEAQVLNKPVIITNYLTAEGQLKNGFDGIIVDMDNRLVAKGIYELYNDKELMRKLSENCSKTDYTNSVAVKKIYKLMEEL